ncbi:hypothetical protein Gogos_020810, partial [Gossypium gossypioides]|nr:hypothetical protein [Gossypium gossypioides]
MNTSAVEVSGKKVKVMWDKRLTEIFCDICIKEILKGEDTGLGWNPIKRIVDLLDDWWESRLKLEQMLMGIVAASDKAWAPSSGTLHSDFFEDVDNEIPKENDEENVRNGVHISNDVHIDGN